MPTKCQEFVPILFVETTNFQLVWADAYSFHIWRAWYNGSYTIMTKPIRALGLHHPMIQFLIIGDVSWINHCDYSWQHPIPQSILPDVPREKTCGTHSKSEQRMWQWWLMNLSNFCCSVRMRQHFSSTSWHYILWSNIKRYWNLALYIILSHRIACATDEMKPLF